MLMMVMLDYTIKLSPPVIPEHAATRTGGATSIMKLTHGAAQTVQAVVSHTGAVTSEEGEYDKVCG